MCERNPSLLLSTVLDGADNMDEVSSDSSESPTEPTPPQKDPTESLLPPSDQPSEPNLSEMPLPPPDSHHSIAIQGQVEVMLPTDTVRKGVFVVKVRSKQGEDAEGQFEVTRKSSDFALLRALLVLHWPGVLLPPLPGGRLFAELMERRDSEDQSERTRVQFQSFLQRLMQIPYLFSTEPVHKFLHVSSDYDKAVPHLKEVSFIEICTVYLQHFLQYMQEPDPEQPIILTHYAQIFKEAVGKLQAFRKVAKSMKGYFESLMDTNERLSACFEAYEADCISEFGKSGEGNYRPVYKRVRKAGYENPYLGVVNWAKSEELEFQSMLEVLEVREKLAEERGKYEAKVRSQSSDLARLQAGKMVLGSLLTLRSRTEMQSELEVELKWVIAS